jgi:rubrerythrin
MTIAIGLLLVALVVAYVAAPFFTGEPAGQRVGPRAVSAPEREKFERQKREAYAAIKEIEFDYRMGKLSDADFTAMRNKFMAEALHAIAVLDASKTAQVKEARQARRPSRIAFCPTCGHSVPRRANFCPGCGRSVREEAVA